MARHLKNPNLPIEVAINAEAFVPILKALPLDSPRRHAYVEAYARSFQNTFEVLTGMVALGFLASLFIKGESLDNTLRSEHAIRRRRRRTSMRLDEA